MGFYSTLTVYVSTMQKENIGPVNPVGKHSISMTGKI
jgi:hypothetical protein